MNILPEGYSSEEDDIWGDEHEFEQKIREIRKEKSYNIANERIDPLTQQKNTVYNAIVSGNLGEIIQAFNEGFDVETNLRDGWTPLLLAASIGNPQIMDELLKRGANVNKTIERCTALMIACDKPSRNDNTDRLETVRLLVENGADVNAVDNKRKTAFMGAAYAGDLDLIEYLMPLCNNNAVDNQKWNALFWAVEGKNEPAVEYLLEHGFDENVKDIRGHTPKDIAIYYDLRNITKLFSDEEQTHGPYAKKHVNFEEIFENLKNKQQPRFFDDVCGILYSIRNESLIPKLAQKEVGLGDLLAVSDEDLKNLDIEMPFQRNRIISALYKFHRTPFQKSSIFFVHKEEEYLNEDVARIILTAVKQVIAMEAALKFIMKHYARSLPQSDLDEIYESVERIQLQIVKLRVIIRELRKKTEWWDYSLAPGDLITKKRRRIPWSNIGVCVLIISSFAIYKLWK